MTQTNFKFKDSSYILALSLLMACSTPSKNLNVFNDSNYFEQNRVPNSMVVPPIVDGENAVIDNTYLQTQADYHYTLGEAMSLEGNSQRALEEFKLTLLYDGESAAVRHRMALEYLKMGLVGEAIESAEEALEKDPRHRETAMLLGGIYTSLRMYDQAYAQYQSILEHSPLEEEASLYIGALLAEQKKFDQAIAHFERFVKSSRGDLLYLSHYYIGRISLEQGGPEKTKKAEAAFQKVLQLKPTHADSVIALASIYDDREQRQKAMGLLESFQARRGPNVQIAQILAQYYLEQKKDEQALEQLRIVDVQSEDDLNIKVKIAMLYVELKRYPEAISKLEEVLTLVPDSDKVRFYLGAVYEELEDNDSAIEQFRKIPPGSQYYAESVIHEAYLLKMSNQVDKAIAAIQEGIRNKDNVPQMYTLYASMLDDKKEYTKAIALLQDAVQKMPQEAQLYFHLGSLQDRVGERQANVTSMKKVLELDPEHTRAQNYLAYTYAEMDQNLEEAEKLARKALQKTPRDAYIMDTLGWVLYKQGRLKEAVKLLEAAHRAKADEGIIAEHLGDVYYKLQLHEKAYAMYQLALGLEQDENNSQKIQQKLVGLQSEKSFRHRQPASQMQSQARPGEKTEPKSK